MGHHRTVTNVSDTGTSKVSPAGGYLYTVGRVKAVAHWTYVAFLDKDLVHLRYADEDYGLNDIGSVGWATNNPGSLDYARADKKPAPAVALLEPEKHGAFMKDPADTLYVRFAIFPDNATGIACVYPVFQSFAKGDGTQPDTTVESTLVKFKGKEMNDSDVVLVLIGTPMSQADAEAKAATMSVQEKKDLVRKNYTSSVRRFFRDELRSQGMTDDTAINARVEQVFALKALTVADGTDDWNLIRNGLLRKEGYYKMPGVEYQKGKGLSSMNRLGYQPSQLTHIDALLAKSDDVEAEMLKVLDG